eukprot:15603204-Heterocapsa_arctica.AAC.1
MSSQPTNRPAFAANIPCGLAQKLRARVASRRAWGQIIHENCRQEQHDEWTDMMPPTFSELSDDHELAVLMMWIW